MSEHAVADIGAQLLNLMKDTLSAAMEATSKTQEQTLRFYDDLAKRGGLAQQEGQRLLQDWIKASRESMEAVHRQTQESFKRLEESVPRGVPTGTLATKQDVEVLMRKIDELTKKVEALGRS